VEDYTSHVGFSERTDAVIEPRLSLQWFLKMDTITRPALEHVMNDDIQLIPPKFKNTYNHWMSNVRDWCISRQLWWGHRIPAWFDAEGDYVIAKTEAEALELFKTKKPGKDITVTQETDVMDTWFSSWLWPIAVFDASVFKDGNRGNADLNYFYPTNDLVTAPEILFFWVARMIIAGYEYRGAMPFKNVYLTGIVRDKQGRKMSKSLGNSPDPLDLIATFGADAVRTGMLFSSPAGNDLLYDEKLIEQGRNFANKIWNAFRMVKGLTIGTDSQPEENKVSIQWFESRLNRSLEEYNDHLIKFRISDALHTIYKLIWDDFCAWYLEMIKPEFGKPIDVQTLNTTTEFFETLLKALHPFMPFITEELWQGFKERKENECLIVASWPKSSNNNSTYFSEREKSKIGFHLDQIRELHHNKIQDGIAFIRKTRQKHGFKNVELSQVFIHAPKEDLCTLEIWKTIVEKLSSSTIELLQEPKFPAGSYDTFLTFGIQWNVLRKEENKLEQLEAIQKEIVYQNGFLNSVNKKLSNEKFVAGAPAAVLENERKKKADAEAKIKALEESLSRLG
jgi:valyl-tRNA synthetase